MNEREVAEKIVRHLNQGLGDIKQGTLYQLQRARQAALERHREVPQAVGSLAWAGNVAFRIGQSRYFNPRYVAALGLLMLGLVGVTYWHWQATPTNDIADIDASLLSGDLPINAYLDSNFEAWLKRSSR